MADETKFPTKEEIAALPKWARVAFAARCARRVVPLCRAGGYGGSKETVKAVAHTVALAEQSAAAAAAASDAVANPNPPSRAIAAAHAADPARNGERVAYEPGFAAAAAAYAAYAAAHAPYATHAADAAALAGRAAVILGTTQEALAKDLLHLGDRARSEAWTDDTPVPPWVFGPMWPDGVPDGWPEADPDDRLVITVEAPPGATAEQVADLRTRLYESANQLVLAHGGPGLTLDLARRLVTINVHMPEGV